MDCLTCCSAAVTERPERTALGYRRFRCRDCGRQFSERSGGVLNHTQYPSYVNALVVLWRLRYCLTLRDLAEMFLAPTPPESHGAQGGATAPRDGAAGAQPRAGLPASAGGASMASTHPLPRRAPWHMSFQQSASTVSAPMRLHRVLDRLLTITVRGLSGLAHGGRCATAPGAVCRRTLGNSGQSRPYVRPVSRRLPLAIMGVRLRARHHSVRRARGTRLIGIAWTVLTTAFPITLVSACCRSRRACARLLPAAPARHATAAAAARTPFAW